MRLSCRQKRKSFIDHTERLFVQKGEKDASFFLSLSISISSFHFTSIHFFSSDYYCNYINVFRLNASFNF